MNVALLPELDTSPSRKHDSPYRLWLPPEPGIDRTRVRPVIMFYVLRVLRTWTAQQRIGRRTTRLLDATIVRRLAAHAHLCWSTSMNDRELGGVASHACMHASESISALTGF
jgi:hypothetical protein